MLPSVLGEKMRVINRPLRWRHGGTEKFKYIFATDGDRCTQIRSGFFTARCAGHRRGRGGISVRLASTRRHLGISNLRMPNAPDSPWILSCAGAHFVMRLWLERERTPVSLSKRSLFS